MNDEGIKALLNALIGATGIGGSALLFGIWDRRRQASKETGDGVASERKRLSENLNGYVDRLEVELDKRRKHIDQLEEELEEIKLDKDRVWTAFRKFESIAYKMRNTASNIIWLCKNPDGSKCNLEELPTAYSLYQAEKVANETK